MYIEYVQYFIFYSSVFPRYILPEMPLCRMLLRLDLDYYLAVSSYSKKSIRAERGAEKGSDEEQEDKKLLLWKGVLFKASLRLFKKLLQLHFLPCWMIQLSWPRQWKG